MEKTAIGVTTTNRITTTDDDSDDDRIVATEGTNNHPNDTDERNDLATEFEPADTDDIITYHNPYVQSLMDSSQLHIIQMNNVKKAYKNAGVLGLFHLFITSSW
jgi:hypothetical protein